jgi:hypothetical protein
MGFYGIVDLGFALTITKHINWIGKAQYDKIIFMQRYGKLI